MHDTKKILLEHIKPAKYIKFLLVLSKKAQNKMESKLNKNKKCNIVNL